MMLRNKPMHPSRHLYHYSFLGSTIPMLTTLLLYYISTPIDAMRGVYHPNHQVDFVRSPTWLDSLNKGAHQSWKKHYSFKGISTVMKSDNSRIQQRDTLESAHVQSFRFPTRYSSLRRIDQDPGDALLCTYRSSDSSSGSDSSSHHLHCNVNGSTITTN